MMAKVEVNGAQAHPLWKWLTTKRPDCWAARR